MFFKAEWHSLNKRGAMNRTVRSSWLACCRISFLKGGVSRGLVMPVGSFYNSASPYNLRPAVKTFRDDRLFVNCPVTFQKTISSLSAWLPAVQLWQKPVVHVVQAQSGCWTNIMGFFSAKAKTARSSSVDHRCGRLPWDEQISLSHCSSLCEMKGENGPAGALWCI